MSEKLNLLERERVCNRWDCFVRPHVERGDQVEGMECWCGGVVIRVVKRSNGGVSIIIIKEEMCKNTPNPRPSWPRKREKE